MKTLLSAAAVYGICGFEQAEIERLSREHPEMFWQHGVQATPEQVAFLEAQCVKHGGRMQ
jgi:hypothetical protein